MSINSLVDVGFEVPSNAIRSDAFSPQRISRGDLLCAAMAQICRVITFSLARPDPVRIGEGELRSMLRGDNASVWGFGVGDGFDGCVAAFEAARRSPMLCQGKISTSHGLMVTVEAKPGILKHQDTRAVRNRIG